MSAQESDIALVVINGVPRFGTPALFKALKMSGEIVKIGSASRRLFFKQDSADPQVGAISLSEATATLQAALRKLPALAKRLEKPQKAVRGRLRAAAPVWRLALDEIMNNGVSPRARLPLGHHTPARAHWRVRQPAVVENFQPLVLDPSTVASDAQFLPSIRVQKNLPPWFAAGLIAAY